MKISDCMCKDVCFVKPDCKVYDAARIMCENHIGCIPICNDERNCIGIVTDRDILLRAIACDKNIKTTPVSDIMTTKVFTCNSEQNISEVENKMAQNQVRRIPVIDNQSKIIGIVTVGDLARSSREIGQDNVCTTVENICNCKGSIQNYY